MRMHRAGRQADWARVPAEKWSVWQRIAADTHGWITPGNLVSVGGFVLTASSLWLASREDYSWSFVFILLGRSADILDGMVADKTGTKSHIGEAADAGIDKLELLAVVLFALITRAVPLAVVLIILIPNLTISALGFYAESHSLEFHPNRTGKLATAALWLAIGSYIAHKATGLLWLKGFAAVALTIALVLVMPAIGKYLLQVGRAKSQGSQSTLQR